MNKFLTSLTRQIQFRDFKVYVKKAQLEEKSLNIDITTEVHLALITVV